MTPALLYETKYSTVSLLIQLIADVSVIPVTVVCKSFGSEQNLKIWRCPIRIEVMSFVIVLIGQCWITTALLLTRDLQTTVQEIAMFLHKPATLRWDLHLCTYTIECSKLEFRPVYGQCWVSSHAWCWISDCARMLQSTTWVCVTQTDRCSLVLIYTRKSVYCFEDIWDISSSVVSTTTT